MRLFVLVPPFLHGAKSLQGISKDMLLLLQDNIRFCILSTKMEEALAVSPLIAAEERATLDADFLEFYDLSVLQDTETETNNYVSPGVSAARKVGRWRYKWARILLHRPTLLWYAISQLPSREIPDDMKASIEICRAATLDLIQDISTTWKGRTPDIMAAWGATWHLYQGTMVPLLILFLNEQEDKLINDSISQVEQAILTLSDLQEYIASAGPSLETVNLLYKVSQMQRTKRMSDPPLDKNSEGASQNQTLPITPVSGDVEWTYVQSLEQAPYPVLQDTAADGLFGMLDWNQYFSHASEYDIRMGFDWDSNNQMTFAENSRRV